MAEPTNTPYPPSTPVPASTPRSTSPAPPMPQTAAGAPMTTTMTATAAAGLARKPIVLHIGDAVRHNPALYEEFSTAFEVVRPSDAERERGEFMRALRERRWGDFEAVFRPFWGSGGEMGHWDAELAALLPASCRVFASAGAGFDWADVRELGSRGVIYCNSGLAAAEAVADFAVAMVISTFRHLPWCMGAGASGSPSAFARCHERATATSHLLRGHVLGLVGLGNIGQQVASKLGCAAFGMRVHYHDVERKPAALEAALGATFHATLESLLRCADCVVLCTPSLRRVDGAGAGAGKTTHLMTRAALAWCRPGGRFVNIARGSLVDEEALADALEAGGLAAAALDVHAREPEVSGRLVRMATPQDGRVMLTCHNAGGTVQTHAGFEELSMRNIMAVLGGGEAITPVNLQFLKRGGG